MQSLDLNVVAYALMGMTDAEAITLKSNDSTYAHTHLSSTHAIDLQFDACVLFACCEGAISRCLRPWVVVCRQR